MTEHRSTTSSIRVSMRAVIAGAIVTLVVIGLLLMLAGGLGLWSMGRIDAAMISHLGGGFALFAGVAWVGAAFVGGYSAAVIARATNRRDGVLHGLMIWAGACAAAVVLACIWFMSAVSLELASVDVASAMGGRMMLAFVAGDLLALAAGLAGGVMGARAEARLVEVPVTDAVSAPLALRHA